MLNLILLFILWSVSVSMMIHGTDRMTVWVNGIIFGILLIQFIKVLKSFVRSQYER